MRRSIAGLVVIAMAIVGACATPPAPTPSAVPAASPSPGVASLTVTASGMVGCATEGGCQASIELDPSIGPASLRVTASGMVGCATRRGLPGPP